MVVQKTLNLLVGVRFPLSLPILIMCVLGIDSNSVRETIQPCMSDPDESGPDRVGLILWAVGDSGSTGALQALGKSSILLRSTNLN